MNAALRWLISLTRWSAEHPVIVMMVSAALLVWSMVQIRATTISGSIQAMLGAGAPAAAALARVSNDYLRSDDLLLMATVPHEPSASASAGIEPRARLLEFAHRLSDAVNASSAARPLCRQIRYQADPSLRDFVREVMLPAGAFYLDDKEFDALLARLNPDAMREQIVRDEAAIGAPGPAANALAKAVLRDPLHLSDLIDERFAAAMEPVDADSSAAADFSDDGQSLLIRISGMRPASDLYFAQQLVDAVAESAARTNTDGLRIDIGGSYAIGAWASRTIRADDISSTIVTVILVQVFFIVFYRRAAAPLLIGGTAGVGIVVAFGIHAMVVSTITPLTAVAAATLAGMGVDYGIHFLSHYQHFRRDGMSSVDASVATIHSIGLALASACLTTLLGFAALWPSRIAMIRDFALLGSLGLVGALLTIYTLMPALMALTDRKPRRASPALKIGLIADWVVARPGAWLAASCLILFAATLALIRVGGWPPLESDLTVMHPRPNPPLDATELIRRKFSAMGDSVLIEVRADAPERLVERSQDVAAALRIADQSGLGVRNVLGLGSLLPDPRIIEDRRRRLSGLNTASVLAAFDAAVRESAFASGAFAEYERFLQTLISPAVVPTIADILKHPSLAEQILPRDSLQSAIPPGRTVLVAQLSQPIHDRLSRDAAIEGLHRTLNGLSGVTVTGTDAVAYEMEGTIRHDLPRTVAISVGLVILWLCVVFRRLTDVALSFVPVAFSMIVLLGFVAATGMRLNAVNGVGLPLLAGIAVDSGVFFVLSFRHHASQGTRADAFGVMCSAVIGTTMTNILGFGSLYWTRTPAVRTLGIVSAVGILAGLWGTLFLLLPLLLMRSRRRASPGKHKS